MSDESLRELLEVQAHFRLPSVALVEKDLYVVRAIVALTATDAAPFDLVFGGGTALARAHRIVRRMSEDVDFKVVPRAAAPVSRSGLRRQLDRLRKRVSTALLDAGFVFDPTDKSVAWARDEGGYAVWLLPYRSDSGAARPNWGEGLRPTIKVELNYAPLRRPAVMLPVQLVRGRSDQASARSAAARLRRHYPDRSREAGLAHPPYGHGNGRRQPRSGPDFGAARLRSAHDAGSG